MVLDCLERFPETRNSDVALTIKIWEEYHKSKIMVDFQSKRNYVFLEDIFDLPREDGIKRIRAKIQNEKLMFLPTDLEVARQRDINYEVWRAHMAQPQFPKTLAEHLKE